MTVADLLGRLQAAGLTAFVEGGRLLLNCSTGASGCRTRTPKADREGE
jgi:hypothetical protein